MESEGNLAVVDGSTDSQNQFLLKMGEVDVVGHHITCHYCKELVSSKYFSYHVGNCRQVYKSVRIRCDLCYRSSKPTKQIKHKRECRNRWICRYCSSNIEASEMSKHPKICKENPWML